MSATYQSASDKPQSRDGKVGYWTRDEVVAMDRAATARMLHVHPKLADEELSGKLNALLRAEEQASRKREEKHEKLAEKAVDECKISRKWKRRELLHLTAQAFGARVDDILSRRRNREVVVPRQVGMFLCKHLTPASFPEISQTFGSRDHTTALHAAKKMEAFAKAKGFDGGDDPACWLERFIEHRDELERGNLRYPPRRLVAGA